MRSVKHKFELRRDRKRRKIAICSDRPRLSVFRSGRHIYASIVKDGMVLASYSTLKECSVRNKSYCNIHYGKIVGSKISEIASKIGLKEVVFDTSGYKYHGVIKALAESAREHLSF